MDSQAYRENLPLFFSAVVLNDSVPWLRTPTISDCMWLQGGKENKNFHRNSLRSCLYCNGIYNVIIITMKNSEYSLIIFAFE